MKKLVIICFIVAFAAAFIGLNALADYGSRIILESTKKAAQREFMGWHGEERVFFDGEKVIYE